MPAIATDLKPKAQQYLIQLRSLLSQLYGSPVRLGAIDLQPTGNVAGVFLDDRDAFEFKLSDGDVRYKPYGNRTLDSKETAYFSALSALPLPLSGNDAYSSGFLRAWSRQDARKASVCTIGYRCRGGCIAKTDECRVELSAPSQKKVKSLVDAGKFLHKLGASPLLVPLLGAAAIGVVGIAAGLSVGSYLGASAAARPAPATPPPPPPAPPRARRPRKPKPAPAPPSDEPPASQTPDQAVDEWAKQTKAKSKAEPKPEPEIEQLPIDQGIRYVTHEVEKKVVVAPENTDGTYMMSPDDMRLAPKLFQYKLPNDISSRASKSYREQGTTGSLEDVETWNPQVAGAVKVWQVPEDFSYGGEKYSKGEVLLVHGHHRLALAKRAQAVANPDPTQPATPGGPDQIKAEFITAKNWKEARVQGAMENIAAGAGTSKDAANIFRELHVNSPDQLKAQGLSLKNQVAEEGMGLAGLNDRLWKKVTDPTNTELSPRRASYVGQIRNPDLQDEVWQQIKETPNMTDAFARSLSQTVQHQLETGQVQTRSENDDEQGSLFDTQKVVANLKDRAEMDAYVDSQIVSEAAFWQKAAKPQKLKDILTSQSAGDIDVDRSQQVSEQTQAARYLYQRGKFLQSDPNYTPITNALIQSGNQLREMRDRGATKAEIDDFKRSTYTAIRDLLARGIGDGA